MDIIINLNKPKHITSQDAVTKVKRLFKVKKAGHTGTLDPLATGVLLICMNRATRLASCFTDLDKEYAAVMKLGESTDTQDAAGQVVDSHDITGITRESTGEALTSFQGEILQTPPMFSALKHKGRALYTYARKGVEIDRPPRKVFIRSIELEEFHPPFVTFSVRCSKGTYIRTLCHDVGTRLGVGAHLHELERTAAGPFSVTNSLTLDELKHISQGDNVTKGIYSMDEALSWIPEFIVDESSVKSVIHGNPVALGLTDVSNEVRSARMLRVKSPEGVLLAIGLYDAIKNAVKMKMVFA